MINAEDGEDDEDLGNHALDLVGREHGGDGVEGDLAGSVGPWPRGGHKKLVGGERGSGPFEFSRFYILTAATYRYVVKYLPTRVTCLD